MTTLKLDALDFGTEVKDVKTDRVKQSYLHYEKDGAALKRLFKFFNVSMDQTTAGRIKTTPLKNRIDRLIAGLDIAGMNASLLVNIINHITDKQHKEIMNTIKEEEIAQKKAAKEAADKEIVK